VLSIPLIALAHGFGPLVVGRLLQGVSAGLVGVVVPLYLAECLSAATRGKGTGIFQWLLTLGIFAAALIAIFFSMWLDHVKELGDADLLFNAQDRAWRYIFWISMPPGILFVIGSFMVAESPRWLFRRGRKGEALAALLRTRSQEEADVEMKEMEEAAIAEKANTSSGAKVKESLLKRKYVVPFLLACIILACNQATGVNSVISYHATILIQAGLSDVQAHWGYVILTLVNFLVTMLGVALVDRKGRKFLLSIGSAGVILSLICTAVMFRQTEQHRVDCAAALQQKADRLLENVPLEGQKVSVPFDQKSADELLAEQGDAGKALMGKPTTLIVIYSYGDFRVATNVVRSDAKIAKPLEIVRSDCIPATGVKAFFSNPFASLSDAEKAPLKIENALITPIPSETSGWLTACFTFLFMAFFAVGPGVCVWLALSELMPTRIRSNGMSIALLLNQAVSTTIAAVFLPTVGKYGYSTMFFTFAGCTVIYFVTAAFFLPETKGKTLEEIEEHFSGKK
jgi:MFS family permease